MELVCVGCRVVFICIYSVTLFGRVEPRPVLKKGDLRCETEILSIN